MTPSTIRDAAAALRRSDTTSVDLLRHAQRQADRFDGDVGVFITRTDDSALEAAQRADEELRAGIDRGPLHGIPIGIKDIVATDDAPTTAQSEVAYPMDDGDAPVVARLRAAGAVVVGKTTTMEFANGLPDPDMAFPLPRNPFDSQRWAGGSSSGSASGIVCEMFLGAVGTDTGGSIRAPAAYCGISGLKPTFGRVPKSGCVPNGYTLDHVGPMAKTAWDCAAMLQAMAGHDASDPSSARHFVPDYLASISRADSTLTIAIDRVNHAEGIRREVDERYQAALQVYRDVGVDIVEVELPHWGQLKAAFSVTSMVEKFSIHRRTLMSQWEKYGRNTRFSSGQGALVSSFDYLSAQRVRRIGIRAMLAALAPFDALVVPTMADTAPLLDGLNFEQIMHGSPTFTSVWNLLGLPAIAVPVGFDDQGLPISMQVVAKPFEEAAALKIAHLFQQHTHWHLATPNIS